MLKQIISLFLVCLLFVPSLHAQEEEEDLTFDKGFLFGAHNGNRGWGFSFNYIHGEYRRKYAFGLDIHSLKDTRESMIAPFLGDQGRRYVYGKLNHFWTVSPMFGIYEDVIPRGNSNILKMRMGLKAGPVIGVLNPYHIELYQAVPGRPFSPDFIVVPYDPAQHSFGEIVGRAGIWSSEFLPKFQLGVGTHLNAMIDFSRSNAAIHGIEVGVKADVFFKEVPLLAEINGISNRKVYISFCAGLMLGGRWGGWEKEAN